MTPELLIPQIEDHRPPPFRLASDLPPYIADLVCERLGAYAEFLEFPLACIGFGTGQLLDVAQSKLPFLLPAGLLTAWPFTAETQRIEFPSGLILFSLPLPEVEGSTISAVGYALARPGLRPPELVLAAAELGWSATQFDEWLAQVPDCPPRILDKLLTAAVSQAAACDEQAGARREIDDLAGHLEYSYEEISLLHALTQNLQISRASHDLAELGLDRLHGLIQAEGHASWLDEGDGETHFLVRGRIPFDELGLARFVSRFEGHNWNRPLVKNRIQGTSLGVEAPGLENIIVARITEGSHRAGWLICCNLSGGREFGTIEARLLGSVASILGTHSRNLDLYRQHDKLLLSFVRSLVSSLDAKDPYTRGHSERVALIARRLGEQMQLPESDLQDIYLAGLLHDIGKIGVDDSILKKPSELTQEEFDQVKNHPIIGYNILAGLTNLKAVIPGVRNHHEAYSGKGYPDGLAGEQIPLMARILAVADSYDAMGSDRPYRKGMPLETLETILRRGAGVQWDTQVIEAYFATREEIKRLCETYSPSDGNLLAEIENQ